MPDADMQQERMELLLAANAQRFTIDESEETQRHRRQQLEDFIMKCCTSNGLKVHKLSRRKKVQPRNLIIDIDSENLGLILKKDGFSLMTNTNIGINKIQDVKAGGGPERNPEDAKFWLTLITSVRHLEIKMTSLKVRDQLLSFLLLLKHVSGGDSDYTDLISEEPGVDVLRDSITEVRQSMSSMCGSDRSSFGRVSDIHSSRDSCAGRDSLSAVWDAKPAFRRSEANVEEIPDDLADPSFLENP